MLISEVLGKSTNDIIKETDEYVLKSILDTIIIRVKDALERSENAHFTLSQVIKELNNNTDTLYIDPRDEDRRNQVMSELEQHGLEVERGSGRIHFAKNDPATAIDDEEAEEKDFEREISRKAMDKVKKDSEDGGIDDLSEEEDQTAAQSRKTATSATKKAQSLQPKGSKKPKKSKVKPKEDETKKRQKALKKAEKKVASKKAIATVQTQQAKRAEKALKKAQAEKKKVSSG